MSRALNKLTDRFVKTTKEPGMYGDGGGLWLQVGPTLGKSWIFRFTSPITGKPRFAGLGAFPVLTLAEARDEALTCRRKIRNGIDPIEERKAERIARRGTIAEAVAYVAFRKAAEAFIEEAEKAGRWKGDDMAVTWRSSLKTYAYPTIGDLAVDAILPGHIKMILDPIWADKATTADRLRGRIEEILDRMAVLHLPASESRIYDNPAAKKRVAAIMPGRGKREKSHHRALPYSEMGAFMAALSGREELSARAMEFLILTATRTAEALEARWSEIDLDKRLWTIPPYRMKAGLEHVVPLTDAAISVLKKVEHLKAHDFVFPGLRPKKPLTDRVLLILRDRMGMKDQLTVHGFRAAFSTWARDCTAFPPDIVEKALAHAIENESEAAYHRGAQLEKRAKLMEAWAVYCGQVAGIICAASPAG